MWRKSLENKVKLLEAHDRALEAHEMSHKVVGGGIAGFITYSYQTGPDGKSYKLHGEVNIDSSEGVTPEETIKPTPRA